MVRWFVDRRNAKLDQYKGLNEDQLQAAGDEAMGCLSSGYIAGGALVGIIIAFSAGIMTDFDRAVTNWTTTSNPFFEGAHADILSLIPFSLICIALYWIGREKNPANK